MPDTTPRPPTTHPLTDIGASVGALGAVRAAANAGPSLPLQRNLALPPGPIRHAEVVRTALLVVGIMAVLAVMAVLVWSIVESWRWQKRVVGQAEPVCVACSGRLPNVRRSNDFRVVCMDRGCLVVRQRMFFHTIERYRLCRGRDQFEITLASATLVVRQRSTGASLFVRGEAGDRLGRTLEEHGWDVVHGQLG